VIITHGRARRRMVGYACEVAARTAREDVPQLIADGLREDAARLDEAGVGLERAAADSTTDAELAR